MKRIAFILLTTTLLFAWSCAYAESLTDESAQNKSSKEDTALPLRIVIPPLEKSAQAHQIYFVKLLELALQKTAATDGPFTINYYPQLFTGKRFLTELARSDKIINVIWTVDNKEREATLLPIRISLLHDLNSYRIFLIRKEDQEKFHSIHTLQQLATLTAGSGTNWPDTDILQYNHLPVATTLQYELLFTMLAGKRFDYFPRGIYEIWNEYDLHKNQGFIIEDSLMLYYPTNIYFFVNKKDHALAERIERGLQLAIKDGSFDQLFLNTPGFKKGYEEIRTSSRQILKLKIDPTNNP